MWVGDVMSHYSLLTQWKLSHIGKLSVWCQTLFAWQLLEHCTGTIAKTESDLERYENKAITLSRLRLTSAFK